MNDVAVESEYRLQQFPALTPLDEHYRRLEAHAHPPDFGATEPLPTLACGQAGRPGMEKRVLAGVFTLVLGPSLPGNERAETLSHLLSKRRLRSEDQMPARLAIITAEDSVVGRSSTGD